MKTLNQMSFLGEISSDRPNDLSQTNVYETFESCWESFAMN